MKGVLALCALVTLCAMSSVADSYKLVCYFTSWAQYRNGAKFMMKDLDANLCTHVIFAFNMVRNGKLVKYEWNDYEQFKEMDKKRAENSNLKFLLAIGGWNARSEEFTKLVKDPAARATFNQQAIQYLRQHKFDGLDLDWEYPGHADQGGIPEDKKRFTAWCQELRAAFTAEAASTGRPRLLLTAAVGVGGTTVKNAYEIAKIANELDFINLMTYDLYGSWESTAGHHTGMREKNSWQTLNVNWAVNNWLQQMPGMANKLILGMGAYARTQRLTSSATNIGASTSGKGRQGQYTGEAGFLSYYEICEYVATGGYTKVFDSVAQAPYAYKGDQWVSYDDQQSLAIKVQFLKNKGLGGAMFWAIDLDDFTGNMCSTSGGQKYPLINSVKTLLNGGVVLTTKGTQGSTQTQSTTQSTLSTKQTTQGSGSSGGCYTGKYPTYNDWCVANCALGNCPDTHCKPC